MKLENLITIGKDGLPQVPKINQIIDKDIKELFLLDKSIDKSNYIKWAGVVYYLGDPQSPPRQQGCSDKECIKEAIEFFDLPKDYEPPLVIYRLAFRLNKEKITEAGVALENILKAIHNSNLVIKKLSELLTDKLTSCSIEETPTIIGYINDINKKAADMPILIKGLEVAKENLQDEKDKSAIYGKEVLTNSMDASQYMK